MLTQVARLMVALGRLLDYSNLVWFSVTHNALILYLGHGIVVFLTQAQVLSSLLQNEAHVRCFHLLVIQLILPEAAMAIEELVGLERQRSP